MSKSRNLPKQCVIIKGLRGREGLSQKQLAKKLNMSPSTLSRMETGKKVLSSKVIKKMAKALKTKSKMFD